ncbi:AAA family ATPase [Mucilaginibacter rubeus]|uniref:AAA family ATPase n=1 Tax=Mucilaginibacter rubeus TaxID=2027860 RepID=A0A5C1I4R4_9SPHI|nr:AAA family ATPase [Mucilaginibacter rubeus]QEM12953.1 AAA family ATPase [Mucilaginibacter rubeus]
MSLNIDFTKLKTSWTKYDIVQVMDVISSEDRIDRYLKRKIIIDIPILRSFLGIKSLTEPVPTYWSEIQNYPEEKRLFALLAVIFTHGEIVKWFAEKFSTGFMQGICIVSGGKLFTNIRSALVESGAAKSIYRRAEEVPYDFTPIYKNGEVGKLFKQVLIERLSRVAKRQITTEEFYQASRDNNFHRALSLTEFQYERWLEGSSLLEFMQKDTFVITPAEFDRKFKEYIEERLTANNLDLLYDFIYKNKAFYLKQKPRFDSLREFFPGIKTVTFHLEQISDTALKLQYDQILNRKSDVPSIGNDVLRIYQHVFSIDLDTLLQDDLFINVNKYLAANYVTKIDAVRIENFYSIKEINLTGLSSTNEIYLLGENGDGKSLVLMAIYLAFNQFYITENTEQERTGKIKDLIQDNRNLFLIGRDENGVVYGKRKHWLNQFFAYGAHRGRHGADNTEKYGFMSLFDGDQVLISPVLWLKDKKLEELQTRPSAISDPSQAQSQSLVQLSISSIQEMLYDILEKNVSITFEGSEIFFLEKGSRLKFDQLSEGYKSVIIFVCDLIFRLIQNQPWAQSIQELKGVVLVDEIDLHLHPKWQFIIIKKLRALFPNVQFVFSTHSPAIIQGASDDAIIYRVYRNEKDGKTKLSDVYYRKNLDHLMINSLVTSPLFGMDSARMNSTNDNSDTSDSYLLYRINQRIHSELEARKNSGQVFITESEIDELIDKLLREDLDSND